MSKTIFTVFIPRFHHVIEHRRTERMMEISIQRRDGQLYATKCRFRRAGSQRLADDFRNAMDQPQVDPELICGGAR